MAGKKRWMYVPPKPPKAKVPEYLKSVVKTKADEFVESFLKNPGSGSGLNTQTSHPFGWGFTNLPG